MSGKHMFGEVNTLLEVSISSKKTHAHLVSIPYGSQIFNKHSLGLFIKELQEIQKQLVEAKPIQPKDD